MPDFSEAFEEFGGPAGSKDFEKYVAARKRERVVEKERSLGPPKPFEPRCHVCTHPYRDIIDSLLLKGGLSYTSIAERMPPGKKGRKLDHRQISKHAKKHLGVGDAAIRAILEDEASQANQDFQHSVRGAVTHRGALEVALRKAYEDIINGVSSVEPRDMIAIGKLLREWDSQTSETQVELYRAQLGAIQDAIQEIVPQDMWGEIIGRARQILERDGVMEMLPAGPAVVPNEAEIVDAEVA